MAKIPRKTQKIFAINADAEDLIEFGSIAAGTAVPATDLDNIQTSEFETGWRAGVVAGSKRLPTLNDSNSINYVFSNQIAYLLQEGIAEYDSSTEYFENSIVKKATTTELYKSLVANNTGNLLTDGTKWELLGDISKIGDLSTLTTTEKSTLVGAINEVNVLPINYLIGLTISNNVSDAAHDIDIAAGKCRDATDTADIVLASGITKKFDTTFAEGTGTGGFASGESLPTSGTIHVWAIVKANGTSNVFANNHATSGLTPTLPSGFVYKRRIASLRTDSSANIIGFIQNENNFDFKTEITDVNTSGSHTLTTRTISTPAGVITKVRLRLYCAVDSSTTSTLDGYLTSTQTDCRNISIQYSPGGGTSGSIINNTNGTLYTNSSSQIRSVSTTNTTQFLIVTLGYIDTRGKN